MAISYTQTIRFPKKLYAQLSKLAESEKSFNAVILRLIQSQLETESNEANAQIRTKTSSKGEQPC